MTNPALAAPAAIFRVDGFDVPLTTLPAFLARIEWMRQLLDTLPGCRQNRVLTRTNGPGVFNVLTIVEWTDAEAMERAKTAVQLAFARDGFDPAAFMEQLGVRTDLGLYHARLVRT